MQEPIDERHTTVRLAGALAGIRGVPKDMITKVVDGYYHDFLSPLDAPEIQLVADLRELASRPATPRDSRAPLRELALRVIGGEFDATPAESKAWAESPEGLEAFRQLGARPAQ